MWQRANISDLQRKEKEKMKLQSRRNRRKLICGNAAVTQLRTFCLPFSLLKACS